LSGKSEDDATQAPQNGRAFQAGSLVARVRQQHCLVLYISYLFIQTDLLI